MRWGACMCRTADWRWVLQDLLDDAIKDERGKRANTKNAIIQYKNKKEIWNPLIKFLWKDAHKDAFETVDIEKSRKSIEIFQSYKVFNEELDKRLMWGEKILTADVMTSAGILIKQFLKKSVKELSAECKEKSWSDNCMDQYLNAHKFNEKASFLVFLRLVYTPGNLIVVGKNKSNQEHDQWDYVMTRVDKYKGDFSNRIPLTKRYNTDVFAPFGESYKEDLYLQDYNEKEIVLDKNNWSKTFDRYSELILMRGIRIRKDIDQKCTLEIKDVNKLMDDLKNKYR